MEPHYIFIFTQSHCFELDWLFFIWPLSSSFLQLHSLSFLQLSYNDLSAESAPDLLASFPSLTVLGLSNCSLKGSIPSTFANLTKLTIVDLSYNYLTGSLSPTLFEGFSNLSYLDLEHNSFSGNIPHSLFGLPSLRELYLGQNQFNGTFRLDNIQNLANLTHFGLSDNNLSVDVGNSNSNSYMCPTKMVKTSFMQLVPFSWFHPTFEYGNVGSLKQSNWAGDP